jgi:hypothetical protein
VPAELQDLDGAAPPLLAEHVAQDHHVVRDELLDPEPGDRAVVLGALRRHHRGDAEVLQGGRDAEQLAPHDRLIGELAEHRAQRVDGDPLRGHLPHRVLDPRQQRAEIEAAALDRLDLRIRGGVHQREPTFLLPLRQIPAEARMFCRMSRGDSSKVTKTPFLTGRDARGQELHANTVLPLPAVPERRVVRFCGSPPSAIRSKLAMPVASFRTPRGRSLCWLMPSPLPSRPERRARRRGRAAPSPCRSGRR